MVLWACFVFFWWKKKAKNKKKKKNTLTFLPNQWRPFRWIRLTSQNLITSGLLLCGVVKTGDIRPGCQLALHGAAALRRGRPSPGAQEAPGRAPC